MYKHCMAQFQVDTLKWSVPEVLCARNAILPSAIMTTFLSLHHMASLPDTQSRAFCGLQLSGESKDEIRPSIYGFKVRIGLSASSYQIKWEIHGCFLYCASIWMRFVMGTRPLLVLFCDCHKIPHQSNKREKVLFGLTFRLQFIIVQKLGWQELEADSHIIVTLKSREKWINAWMLVLRWLRPFHSAQSPAFVHLHLLMWVLHIRNSTTWANSLISTIFCLTHISFLYWSILYLFLFWAWY